MDKSYSDEKIIDMIESGQPLFNHLQTEVMRSYAADEIYTKKIIVRECISSEVYNTCSFSSLNLPSAISSCRINFGRINRNDKYYIQ